VNNNDNSFKEKRRGVRGTEGQEEEEEEKVESLSPILSTRYAHKAAQMIRPLQKNFLFVTCVITALFVFALIDIIQVKGYFYILPDEINDTIIIIFATISLAALLFVLRFLLKSRKLFNNWANLFERNSIRAGINIVMADKTKEEAIRAVAETVEELGEPLRNYISSSSTSKGNFKDIINVTIGKGQRSEQSITYDVLMDADRIREQENTTTTTTMTGDKNSSDDLKRIFKEYGAVIVKIADGSIDIESIRSFFNSLLHYLSVSKSDIGLAIIIGESASQDAYNLSRDYAEANKRIHHLLLIEKPTTMAS
jgi:hypothetical protein